MWQSLIDRLLGRSTYPALPAQGPEIDSDSVETTREAMGGQLSPMPTTRTRWYMKDLEAAEKTADVGDMTTPAQLMRSARRDGIFAGVLSTCTDGLVRLPKKFRGDPTLVKELEQGHDTVISAFDEMNPPQELALMAADGRTLGVAVGELVPVEGRAYPVLVRLEPEFLLYRWSQNRWYYRSIAGVLPITPGDGRWVLHTPGGRMSPWQNGIWKAIARAFIRKEHAAMHKDNWEGKLANPARVAVAPSGAAEEQAEGWFKAVLAWGINTVFGMRPGYDVKLVESNGRGWESFDKTIEAQNTEMIITVAGQTVTTEGGRGFQNSDIHKSIRADIIKSIADSIAFTINTQILPTYIAKVHGEQALATRFVTVEWDVTPPKDRNSEALSLQTAAQAISLLQQALASEGLRLDAATLCTHFAIPVLGDQNGDGKPEKNAAALRALPTAEPGSLGRAAA